jgi:hypothetical protein
MLEAVPARPVKPSKPAIKAKIRNINAHPNISILPFNYHKTRSLSAGPSDREVFPHNQ